MRPFLLSARPASCRTASGRPLVEAGAEVLVAATLEDAAALLERERPDVASRRPAGAPRGRRPAPRAAGGDSVASPPVFVLDGGRRARTRPRRSRSCQPAVGERDGVARGGASGDCSGAPAHPGPARLAPRAVGGGRARPATSTERALRLLALRSTPRASASSGGSRATRRPRSSARASARRPRPAGGDRAVPGAPRGRVADGRRARRGGRARPADGRREPLPLGGAPPVSSLPAPAGRGKRPLPARGPGPGPVRPRRTSHSSRAAARLLQAGRASRPRGAGEAGERKRLRTVDLLFRGIPEPTALSPRQARSSSRTRPSSR